MFTGLIEEVGAISRRSGADITVMAETVLEGMREGDSIAVSGACLTAVAFDDASFVAQISPETLERTTLSSLRPGDAVNLERALAVGDRLGGHMMQGHIDGIGRVASIESQGEFSLWRFQAPDAVARYIVPKGSIAVDGVSLTVVEPSGDTFGVAVIPATIAKTTLASRRAGDAVNLEADMIGKHIYHYLKGTQQKGLTLETLQRQGFA